MINILKSFFMSVFIVSYTLPILLIASILFAYLLPGEVYRLTKEYISNIYMNINEYVYATFERLK